MSYVSQPSTLKKLRAASISVRNAAYYFFRDTMAGQKLFLHHEDFPRVINISPLDYTCMYACRMCPFTEQETRELYSEPRKMSFETLRAIVSQVPNDPHYSFDISAFGETLVFKELPDFISYMKSERPLVNTVVSTNALPLTEEMFRGLVNAGLDSLQLSIYAQDPESYARVTKSKPENFERVKSNVKKAYQIREEMGRKNPFMQAFIFAVKENEEQIPAFLDEWSTFVDKAFVRHVYSAGREIEGLTPTRETPLPQKRYPCMQPWYSTGIDADGNVHPCRMFQWYAESRGVTLGNIRDKSLKEMWASEVFKAFRDDHLSGNLDQHTVCKGCDTWSNYTNVWDEDSSGQFAYNGVTLKDFFKRSTGYRGG